MNLNALKPFQLNDLSVAMGLNYRVIVNPTNPKIGNMPCTYNSHKTCPDSCELKGTGCMMEQAHNAAHAIRLDEGKGGAIGFQQYLLTLKSLPRFQVIYRNGLPEMVAASIRLRIDGDIPSGGMPLIGTEPAPSLEYCLLEAESLKGLQAIIYSHHNLVKYPYVVKAYSIFGQHINQSCDTLQQAKECIKQGINAVMTTRGLKKVAIIEGVKIVQCPAEYAEVSCSTCGNGNPLCARKRGYAIGFNAHGVKLNSMPVAVDLSAKGVIEASKGRFMAIRYRKKDGEITTLLARTGVTRHLVGGGRSQPATIKTVWSADRKGYRSLILSQILSIKTGGVTYDFTV